MKRTRDGTDLPWTEWVPEIPEDVDVAAENLNGQMMAGSLVHGFKSKMGRLYIVRTDMAQFRAGGPNRLTFRQIMDGGA